MRILSNGKKEVQVLVGYSICSIQDLMEILGRHNLTASYEEKNASLEIEAGYEGSTELYLTWEEELSSEEKKQHEEECRIKAKRNRERKFQDYLTLKKEFEHE